MSGRFEQCPHCGTPITLLDRFMRYVSPEPNTGCWLWTSHASRGYGYFWMGNKKTAKAHRVSYELFIGKIPEGLVIDHKCRTVLCVNPAHLEAVSSAENTRRGLGPVLSGARQKAKTHCPQGHPYDEANTYINIVGARCCRKCRNAAVRKWEKRKAAEKRHVFA